MSTEARDKAARAQADWAEYRESDRSDLVRFTAGDVETSRQRRGFFAGHLAGWDARGQVTPDREAIAWAVAGVTTEADWVLFTQPQINEFRKRADAILALFNEKGND